MTSVDDEQQHDGDVSLFYPSGRMGVTITRSKESRFALAFSDTDAHEILVSFDSTGVGGACFPGGHPWLSTTAKGYTVSDEKGAIVESGRWPRAKSKGELVRALTPSLTVRFASRQDIALVFNTDEIPPQTFHIGQVLKREGTYLDYRMTSVGGKMTLDVRRIREKFAKQGHLYSAPGPHSLVTERPGLGNLRKMVAKLGKTQHIDETLLGDLDETQRRLRSINTVKTPLDGTVKMATKRLPPLDDFGEPPMTDTMKDLRRKLRPQHVTYQSRQARVEKVAMAGLDHLLTGDETPESALVVVCCVASWNAKPCAAATQAMRELQHDIATLGEAAAVPEAHEHSCPLVLRLMDASEGNGLRKRFGFLTVPAWLVFRGGKLVEVTNDVRGKEDLKAQIARCLAKAARDEYLPDGWQGSLGVNPMLETIMHPGFTLSN
ncbi:unnamed protein product [Pedinophyceae sp. YPF-701]|nr:unnamed protein product [Pedinophyceae sp. YPF-701]